VHKSFGQTAVIQGVSLAVPEGERHAIIGPNGSGKTTLFNLISGRLPVSSGIIELDGQPVQNRTPYEINRLGLGRSFQITSLFPRLSAFENLCCALLWPHGFRYSFWHMLSAQPRLTRSAEQWLERLALIERRDAPAGALSYAEQRALEIGVTIAGGARVILLDEPTAGMDRGEIDRATALIRQVTDGKTLIMVEHDMSVVFGIADRISVLVHGQIIASDTPEAVHANGAVQEAYLGAKAA
jgi:branched-chain amino acid transport system ATP-binding protein